MRAQYTYKLIDSAQTWNLQLLSSSDTHPNKYSDRVSDIPCGSIYSIGYMNRLISLYIYIYTHTYTYYIILYIFFLTFYLTCFLANTLTFPASILNTFYLLANSIYADNFLAFYLASVLTFFLASIVASVLTFFLASIVASILAFYSGIYWHCL